MSNFRKFLKSKFCWISACQTWYLILGVFFNNKLHCFLTKILRFTLPNFVSDRINFLKLLYKSEIAFGLKFQGWFIHRCALRDFGQLFATLLYWSAYYLLQTIYFSHDCFHVHFQPTTFCWAYFACYRRLRNQLKYHRKKFFTASRNAHIISTNTNNSMNTSQNLPKFSGHSSVHQP